ncbi:MAG: hypothetical protein HKN72_16205 [Gemmatimonadetes bacterium]|nr:hypothetical protein [Gemmatimonadota bacterium]
MDVLRGIGAVVLGYVLSQGINGLFVYFWHIGDRTAPPGVLPGLTFLFFLAVGLASGWVCVRVGGRFAMRAAWVLAGLVGLVTVGNIVADVAAEPLWHKLIVLLVMAPAIVVAARKTSPAPGH